MANEKDFKGAGGDLFFSANDTPPESTPEKTPAKEEAAISADKPKKAKTKKYADILESIKQPDELPGANITFYLEKEVIDAIIRTSNEMNISRSKLINKLLKKILLGDD